VRPLGKILFRAKGRVLGSAGEVDRAGGRHFGMSNASQHGTKGMRSIALFSQRLRESRWEMCNVKKVTNSEQEIVTITG
jgi:hypothetical protein